MFIMTILLKTTFSSVSKIKAAFYWTAACHGSPTATDTKAAGCTQKTLSHVYILNFSYLSVLEKENSDNNNNTKKVIG